MYGTRPYDSTVEVEDSISRKQFPIQSIDEELNPCAGKRSEFGTLSFRQCSVYLGGAEQDL